MFFQVKQHWYSLLLFRDICFLLSNLSNFWNNCFARGTKAQNRRHLNREIQSTITFNFVFMYSALYKMLNLSVLSTNV